MNRSKKLLALFTAGLGLMLSSCGDDVVESFQGPITTEAALNVVVRDGSTGSVINDAEVTLLTTTGEKNKNGMKSATGTVTFEGVRVGEQRILIEKKGYTSRVLPTGITRDDASVGGDQGIYIADDNTVEADIYPLTSSLDGYLYYDKDGKSLPAAGAGVRLTLSNTTFENRILTVKTNKDGLYSFNSLPAVGNAYTLTALEHKEGSITYKEKNLPNGDRASLTLGAAAHVTAKLSYTEAISPFVYLGTNTLTIERGEPVVLTFSDDIDITKIVLNPVTVSPDQPVEIKYNKKTLTLTPHQEWTTTGGQVFIDIDDNLVSVKGNNIAAVNITVNVLSDDLVKQAVKGLKRDSLSYAIPTYQSTDAKLYWNKVSGAASYDVYVKLDGTNNYKIAEADVEDTFTVVDINDAQAIEGKTSVFVVQAKNARSKSTLNGAAELEVFSRPTVDGNITNLTKVNSDNEYNISISNFEEDLYDALMGTALVENLGTITIKFTESMDKSSLSATVGTFSPKNARTDRISVGRAKWSNDDKELELKIEVTAGTAATASNAVVNSLFSISGLKSKNGKAFFVEYSGSTKAVKSSLDIRFKSTAP